MNQAVGLRRAVRCWTPSENVAETAVKCEKSEEVRWRGGDTGIGPAMCVRCHTFNAGVVKLELCLGG
jgi:hypothetical protein